MLQTLNGPDAYVYLAIPQSVCSSQSDTLTKLHAHVPNWSLNCLQ